MQNEEEILREIQVTAQRLYPGRGWDQLSPQEQEAVYRSYSGERDVAGNMIAQGQRTMNNAGKTVGPSRIYVNNPWESLAGGLQAGIGISMANRANKQESLGRKANADMLTRRDALDREDRQSEARREEERRREWLSAILGGRQ
ncbi:hypothetical protein [Pseudohalioglobus lutimaris]|uniref:Uncharacterized protein n=1 Tax=Pseudohalioglobus lutimaris TaxID=1737061 RepID=A0A2N5X4P4_9GAMM|nr:hypothetical protein [Pseudohalioglobus lutimaris]PLW69451.1 hypothetical protein C0039_07955 [Pseudohalioglobus lutimaris]